MDDSNIDVLLAPWQGPLGGLPPLDRATPAAIEAACRAALDRWEAEVAAIAADPNPPCFDTVIAALEDSGRAFRRVDAVRQLVATTGTTPEMRAVNQRLAPLSTAFEDRIAHDPRLFARIEAVAAKADALSPDERALTRHLRDRLVRRGARLDADGKAAFRRINARIAELQTRFQANLVAEEGALAVEIDAPDRLDGVSAAARAAAAALAERRGRPGAFAFGATRPAVMAVLQNASDRALREAVWRMWTGRGANPGEHDNRPIINEILVQRRALARLFGYPSYAAFQCADRMAGTPERATQLLERVWRGVMPSVDDELADLTALAAADGVTGPLQPWDRLYYAERLKATRFGFDAEATRAYLSLDNVLAAAFDAAGRLHGLAFRLLADAPAVHPDVRVYEVTRNGDPIGALWLDLVARDGKGHGSWQYELRPAERFRGTVPALSAVMSSNVRPADGGPVLLGWDYANVLFHEFGHALHMLLGRARYPSLGSMAVAWDFIEVPALLNERWLLDPALLRRFARHHETGEPMPEVMIAALEAAVRHGRVFSLTLDYLAVATVDLALFGPEPGDAQAIEAAVLARLGMPSAIDPLMRVTHCMHSFTDAYAAGVYSYLWADVMAADIGEAFTAAPGGLYDPRVAARWRNEMLSVGATVPADAAFRAFRGREPDGGALLRRFDLAA